jgi:hypothetical protein
MNDRKPFTSFKRYSYCKFGVFNDVMVQVVMVATPREGRNNNLHRLMLQTQEYYLNNVTTTNARVA